MAEKKKKAAPKKQRIRDIAWEIGKKFPLPLTSDYIDIFMISPRRGCLQWNVRDKSLKSVSKKMENILQKQGLIIRVYDVTDLIFNGSNAHSFFDFEVGEIKGTHYFNNDKLDRNLIAEAGLLARDGSFHAICRSHTAFFEREGPAAEFSTVGLFVGGTLNRTFSVENIFDAPIFEKMNRELAGRKQNRILSVAAVYFKIDGELGTGHSFSSFIQGYSKKMRKFGGNVRIFEHSIREDNKKAENNLIKKIESESKKVSKKLYEAHEKTPFHVIHCHDWYSSKVGLNASKRLKLPFVLSLHSTEYERTQGTEMNTLSVNICAWEKKAINGAHLIIVPHSYTRQQVINLYGASSDRVVIIPDVLTDKPADFKNNSSGARQMLGIPADAPIVLFAGEMSHAAGADLLIEAIPTVCRNHGKVHFVFAGDGPLKGELESRAFSSGIGNRCRFLGHVVHKSFESILIGSDFVVIPARTWQDEGFARVAIEHGRPVLTTQQSGINCVIHGKTGLVTFDNPGSIVWGIQEMLFNPMKDNMMRLAVRKVANEVPSLESIGAQHYLSYDSVCKDFSRRNRG